MKADPRGVLTGTHFLDGDHACCEGALAQVRDSPPDIPSRLPPKSSSASPRAFPPSAARFIQMEDELAASITMQGAVWGGAKAFTVTSGPGFSLMMEHIGYAAMTETPCVFVDVQRGGPSTGLPTLPAQADMMQARWGSHGDYEIIALCPELSAGMLRPHHPGLQLRRRISRPGHVHDGRSGRPHDREGRHPPGRSDRSRSAPSHQQVRRRLPALWHQR